MHLQNSCLLMKLLARIYAPPTTAWLVWFLELYGWSSSRDLGDTDRLLGDTDCLDIATWMSLLAILPQFLDCTVCVVGNGRHTAFWHDLWHGQVTFAARFPALFSHVVRLNACVAAALPCINEHLQSKLSTVARAEIATLHEVLRVVTLRSSMPESRDMRPSGAPFMALVVYRLAMSTHEVDAFAPTMWRSHAPGKCNFFLWLCHRRRLPFVALLCRRHIIPSVYCVSCGADETPEHLLLECSHARDIWALALPGALPPASVEAMCSRRSADLPDPPRLRSMVCIIIL